MKHPTLTASFLATLLLGASLPSAAAPTLIGDTISFLRSYPTPGTQFGNAIPDTTVAAGTGDVVGWSYPNRGTSVTFDPEANSILFSFLTTTAYGSTSSDFDGYVISGIDAEVASLSVLGNTTNYSIFSLSNDGHGFRIALDGSSAPGTILIGLQLRDVNAAAVPEPGTATLALGALAVLGVRSRRRRGSPVSSRT